MGDNNRTRGPRTLDTPQYSNSLHAIQMLWILVLLLRKLSLKQTRKNIERKVAASNAINKATLLGTVLARKLVLTPPELPMPLKLQVLSQKPLLKKQ